MSFKYSFVCSTLLPSAERRQVVCVLQSVCNSCLMRSMTRCVELPIIEAIQHLYKCIHNTFKILMITVTSLSN